MSHASPDADAAAAVAEALGARGAARWTRRGSGALNDTFRLDAGAERWFVKIGGGGCRTMYEAEAEGLRALAGAGAVRVPQVCGVGSVGASAWLVLEWLDLGAGGRDAPLGRALAALHRTTAPRFGWHRDNTIGTTPQHNAWMADWATFFTERRLAPQLRWAAASGHHRLAAEGERLLPAVRALLGGRMFVGSLLHGDLWSGNAAALRSGEPVVFDPAVYFGDRETDLAMTELFGGFGADFHAAYREAWPLDVGYAVRRDLYDLYHVLNHLNIFGRAYERQALTLIRRLLAEARA